jgi:hypothetical protein
MRLTLDQLSPERTRAEVVTAIDAAVKDHLATIPANVAHTTTAVAEAIMPNGFRGREIERKVYDRLNWLARAGWADKSDPVPGKGYQKGKMVRHSIWRRREPEIPRPVCSHCGGSGFEPDHAGLPI